MSKGWLPWAGALGSVALLAIFLSVMLGGSKEPSRSMAKNGRATPPSVSNPPEPPPAAPAQPAPPATHPSSGSAPAEIPVPRTLPEEPAKTLPSGALFYRFDTQEALQRFERDFEVYAGSGNVSIQVDGRPVPHRWVGVREIKDGKLRLSFRVTEEVSAKWGMAPHDFKLAHRTWKGDWEYACRLEIPPATEQLVKSANAFLFFHLQTTHGVKTSGAMLKIPNHYTRLFGGLVVDKGDLSPNTETFSIPARLAKSMYRNHGVFDLRWIKRGAHLKCMIDGTEAYGGEIPAHLLERMDRYPVRIGFVIYPPQDHWLALESLYFGPPRDEAP